MGHGLEMRNGRYEAAFAVTPAWHTLGKVLKTAVDAETMGTESGLSAWSVLQEPVWNQYGRVPGFVANVRSDTKETLGIVTDSYRVVQNVDAFRFLDSLTQDGVMKYESAGALYGGRRVWVLARMPEVDTVADGDDCLRYVLFTTSHDGSYKLTATPTSVRVVCANTLAVATAEELKLSFRHSGDMRAKLDYARKYLSQFNSGFTLFRDEARKLATKKYDPAAAKEYIASLFPAPESESKAAATKHETKLEALRNAMRSDRQQLGGAIKGTWWSLYNAVSEYVDHSKGGFRGETDAAKAEGRFVSLTTGADAAFKRKAFELATKLAV